MLCLIYKLERFSLQGILLREGWLKVSHVKKVFNPSDKLREKNMFTYFKLTISLV